MLEEIRENVHPEYPHLLNMVIHGLIVWQYWGDLMASSGGGFLDELAVSFMGVLMGLGGLLMFGALVLMVSDYYRLSILAIGATVIGAIALFPNAEQVGAFVLLNTATIAILLDRARMDSSLTAEDEFIWKTNS